MRGLLNYAFSAALSLAVAFAAPWSQGQDEGPLNKAIYFLNNEESGDNIVAMPIREDGSLGVPVFTSTGGFGGNPVSTLATPAGVFFSQSIIKAYGNYLFTVNPKSATLSYYTIDPYDPTRPRLVSTVSTGGYFPMSVDYSDRLSMVCALNAGGDGGIACFNVCDSGLTSVGNNVLPINKGYNQTQPVPTGPAFTISQILFNPDSTALISIVKGSPKPPTPGKFVVYPINNKTIASEAIESTVDDMVFNFGAAFVTQTKAVIAAASFGGAVIELESNWTVTQTQKLVVADQKAICWSQSDLSTGVGYFYDAGRTTVINVDVASGQTGSPLVATIPNNNGTQGGLYDTVIMGGYSWSLADPNGVVGFNLKTGNQTGFYDLSSYGNRTDFWGMTGYSGSPSSYGW